MKKKLLICLMTLITLGAFAQKTIENPAQGLSNLPGSITKVEILDNETILHFHLKTTPNSKFSIPKKSYIQDLSNTDKLFVIKAKGARIAKWETVPESGEVDYILHFPKINKNVKSIEFGEANRGGSWYVYDIVITPDEDAITPKKLLGNWFKTDGSNLYQYSFTAKNVIINKQLWNYKTVKEKRNKFKLVLEKDGVEKNMIAKLDNNETLEIKENKKADFSQNIINNVEYKPKKNESLENPIIKLDTATYAGIIKNYTPRIGIKTGTVYVNNVFTGEQETHLIRIAEDGTFSVKIPVTHPQFILSRVLSNNQFIYIVPGKETFHVFDGNKSFFMGDLAQVNTDLEKMRDIRVHGISQKTRKNILQIKPEDFKAILKKQYTEALQKIEELRKTAFISKKALELKKISLEYRHLTNILSYDMYSRSAKRNLKPEELKGIANYKIDKTYLSEITLAVLTNKKAMMTERYSSFINYLTYLELFNNKTNSRITANDVLKHLQEHNQEISEEQLNAIAENKLLNTPERQKKQEDFNKKYGKRLSSFYKENAEAYQKIAQENPDGNFFKILKKQLINKGKLNPLDEKMLTALDNIISTEEKVAIKDFQEKHGESLKEFNNKYSDIFKRLFYIKHYTSKQDNMKEILEVDSALVFDIFTLQMYSRRLTNDLIPYTDTELKNIKKEITDKDVANYLDITNNKTIATLEANKTKKGYHVNKVEKTESDELFDSMIAQFKGKVIYVDFWATWCVPCRSGIQRIATLKEEMANKEVVFLYISAPSSPEKTWNNVIPDIKGEHYRVSQDEWNYLKDKFKITGIPHYALVNKKGELVNSKLGHNSNDGIKKILETELNK